MPDTLRRLNQAGIDAFTHYLQGLKNNTKSLPPKHLLADSNFSEQIGKSIAVENNHFQSRYEMGSYLCDILQSLDYQRLLGDTGLWNWLALYWFDQLCPADKSGARKPSKPYNYILSTNYNHRPRHALYTTWRLVSKYNETALFLLSKAPNERGELIEQLAARQYLISCKGVIEAAARLYFDPDRKTFKRGSASQSRKGNIRRFISFLQQLELTYDLGTLASDSLFNMLPGEYEAFAEKG